MSEEIQKVFRQLDRDRSGELDADELRIAFDMFGLRLSPEEVATHLFGPTV